MALFSWLASFAPSQAEVRAEVWRLGVRHHGEPLLGAREEIAAQGLSPERLALLQACVRTLRNR